MSMMRVAFLITFLYVLFVPFQEGWGAPHRIISTAPNNTEILFALGLGEKIVGVTTQCDFPPEAKRIEKIGDLNLNFEKIIQLKPDLIVSHGELQRGAIQKLQSFHLPVLVIRPSSLTRLLDAFHLIGKRTGHEKEANRLIHRFQATLQKRERKSSHHRVLVCFWRNPLQVLGKGTLVDDMLNRLGVENLGREGRGPSPTLNMEWVLEKNPDSLIFTKEALPKKEALKKDPKWRMVKAVKENRILILENPFLEREGPRSLETLQQLDRFL